MNGYKTYIIAAIIGILAAAHYLGYLTGPAYDALLGIFSAGGLAALRAGVEKASPR